MIRAIIDGHSRPLEVIDYSVSQSINSMTPGDNGGGTGSLTITTASPENGALVNRVLSAVDKRITLYDTDDIEFTAYKGRGVESGIISAVSQAGARITFSVDSILNRLNVDKVATPFFGKARPSFVTSYIINLATNPSAEAAGTTNYTTQAGTSGTAAVAQFATGSAFSGTKSMRMTWSVAATGVGGLIYTHSGVTPGNTYTFSTNVRTDGAQNIQIGLQWLDAASANIGSVILGSDQYVDNAAWVPFSMVGIVAPALAAKAKITLFNFNNGSFHNWATTSTLEADGWMINQGDVLYPFADGNSSGGSWLGTADASASQVSVLVPQDPGYNATFANAFRYYCSLVGIGATSIVIDPSYETFDVAFPGWEGNVLDHLKMMCSAYGADFSASNDVISVSVPRSKTIRVENLDTITRKVSAQGTTREVQLTNYNNRWLTNAVTAQATSVYSLDVGQPTDFFLPTTDSLASVNNPVCVAAIGPVPYSFGTGQYVVTDSNNNVVNPTSWVRNGGNVIVEIDPENSAQIHVVVSVPTSITGYVAPYRLATTNINQIDTPALFITGTGVFVTEETITKVTGATVSQTTKDQAPTVQNIFMSTIGQTSDRGYYAADDASGPSVVASGSISFNPDSGGQEFGKITGARFKTREGIYRLGDVTISRNSINFSDAKMDVTFDDLTDLFSLIFNEFDATYAGLTFAAFDALWAPGFTFQQFDDQTDSPTFADYDAIYDGATFNDHAVYPYLKEAMVEDAEARF